MEVTARAQRRRARRIISTSCGGTVRRGRRFLCDGPVDAGARSLASLGQSKRRVVRHRRRAFLFVTSVGSGNKKKRNKNQ